MEGNNPSSLEHSSTVEQLWPFRVHIGDAAVVHLKGPGAMLSNIGKDDTLLDVQVKPDAQRSTPSLDTLCNQCSCDVLLKPHHAEALEFVASGFTCSGQAALGC